MKTARASFFGLGLAILTAACSSPMTGGPGTGGSGATGTAGTSGSCLASQMLCAGQCSDVSSDNNNCGSCGIPCAAGKTCQSGMCKCQSGLLDCNGSCVPSDATNCGSCGNACGANQVCSGTSCSSSCTGATPTACGTACCSTSQTCTNGACIDMGGGGTTGTGGTTGSGGSAGGTSGTTGKGGSTGTGGRGGAGGSAAGTGGSAGTGTGGSAAGTGGTTATAPKVITSANGAYWNTSGTIATSTGTATVTVNDGSALRAWEGFGGAFNELGWKDLMTLSQADRDNAMQMLFGTNGAHFGWGRIPIGASDYAINRYTEDETANDTALSNFSISQDMMYLIPYVNAAKAVNPNLKFWASPWTPPTWMKTFSGTVNGTSCANMGGSNFNGGCMNASASNLTTLANYFVKWIQAYKAQGIGIDYLAPQNEPNYSQGYPSCIWAPADYTKFTGQLGPALTSASLTTKVMLGTMSNGDSGSTSKDLMVVQAVMADATAKGVVNGNPMGLQWGMLDLAEGQSSGVTVPTSGVRVWATEHKCGNYPWITSAQAAKTAGNVPLPAIPAYVSSNAPNDQAYGVESWWYIRDAITKGKVTSYSAWNMILDRVGLGIDTSRDWRQDALIAVNGGSLNLTPAYYVFRHAAQYTQVGATVVTTSGGDAFAFKNPDGSVVAVMYNSGGANASYTVQIKGQKYQFSMPAAGWATVVIP